MGFVGVTGLIAKTAAAAKEILFGGGPGQLAAIGWAGFLDYNFMLNAFGTLLLAITLGWGIGYHPRMRRTVDSLVEADMPKTYILYAFIGAVIGVAVREFGMVVGVVVFGIGGLIRFRSTTDSTRDTGRLIVVTLMGLVTGLGLPHLGAMIAIFAYALIWIFDSRPACRVKVEELPKDRLEECASLYRGAFEGQGCRIIAESRNSGKGKLDFVIRLPPTATRESMHEILSKLPPDMRGDVDWEID
jgi:hypothetical protein